MPTDSSSDLDADLVVAWIAATQDIVVPLPVAEIVAVELGLAARHALIAMRGDLLTGDHVDFLDVLEAYADTGI